MTALASKVIGCQVVLDAMLPYLSPDAEVESVPMSLHVNPKALTTHLQGLINDADGRFDPIILGFGLCSQATVGLTAARSHLVVARTDDCIGIFLGSRSAYRAELREEPGTYFLTRGWSGSDIPTPFAEYDRAREKWGEERAKRLLDSMLRHYRRLVYIDTPGDGEVPDAHEYAREISDRFSLEYERRDGDDALIRELSSGPWGERCMVVKPGNEVQLEAFLTDEPQPTLERNPHD